MDHDTGAFAIIVEKPYDGKRLDFLVSAHIPDCSRSVAADLIRSGIIRVCGNVKKAAYRVRAGDEINGRIPPPEQTAYGPEPIPLSIVHEDAAIIVVNKQPGLVVHPAPGHASGTLVNALMHHCPGIQAIGGALRPGIVHRLDRDTSGTMVVAKNAIAMAHLSHQFKSRQVRKEYLALVHDNVADATGSISLPIGRHPVDRKRMSIRSRNPRTALTEWRVIERFDRAALLNVRIHTGRTHQIRVHCAAIHHPVVGDPIYGGRKREKTANWPPQAAQAIKTIRRQMLHAWRLRITHPVSEKTMIFESPIPADMAAVIDGLRGEKK